MIKQFSKGCMDTRRNRYEYTPFPWQLRPKVDWYKVGRMVAFALPPIVWGALITALPFAFFVLLTWIVS